MCIQTEQELAALRKVAGVVRETLDALKRQALPGVATIELDRIAGEIFDRYGARSAPRLTYGFPGNVLISINDEIVHGIPGERRIEPGDMVKIDVTPELDGYIADAAETVVVPPQDPLAVRLSDCTRRALDAAIDAARAGRSLRVIGQAVEPIVREQGFSVVPELTGHGVGKSIHEEPKAILNYDDPRFDETLEEGMVITIEPLVAVGTGARFTRCYTAEDKWTLKTSDGTLAAHFEHTLVITKNEPMVLTA